MGKSKVTTEKCVEVYLQTGSLRKAAQILGVSHAAVALHLEKYKREKGEDLVAKLHQKPMTIEVLKQRADANIADLAFIFSVLEKHGEGEDLKCKLRELLGN